MIAIILLLSCLVVFETVYVIGLKKEIKRKDVNIEMLECVIIKLKKG